MAALILRQLVVSDRILLNKADLVTDTERETLIAAVRRCNPAALLLPCSRASVPLHQVDDSYFCQSKL
jgi:G3E family GTPase